MSTKHWPSTCRIRGVPRGRSHPTALMRSWALMLMHRRCSGTGAAAAATARLLPSWVSTCMATHHHTSLNVVMHCYASSQMSLPPGQSEGLESPSPPRSSEGDPKPHPLHFRAPEAQAVGGSSQEEEFGRLPPTVPPYPQEHDCSPSSEASAPPEAGSPGLEWVGLPSPQTPPPQVSGSARLRPPPGGEQPWGRG